MTQRDSAARARSPDPHALRIRVAAALGCSLAFLAAPASATESIEITARDCAPEVRLVARDAHLSAVLARLADAMKFTLQFESSDDPIVNLDMSRQAPDLIRALAPTDNVIVTQARDSRCPQRQKIVKVWVLPKGSERSAAAKASTPAAPADPAAERAREMKRLGMELEKRYIEIHGRPSPTVEEQSAY